MLDDYRVTKDKRIIKQILKELELSGHWNEILSPNCSFETLNTIKKQLIANPRFEEKEVVETLAYLGYGMQLT